jgi:RNA polymerase sigma-70 factor, ECF subfamily
MKMEQPTEQELLNGARKMDLPVLGAIYDRYSPGIYRYAMRLLGDECQAEDCVAETFSRFLKGLRAGQGPQDYLQAYLYRIAHNWITDSYRRQPPPPLALDDNLPDASRNRPDRLVENLMERRQVRLALRALTPDQRQVVTLRFLEGCDNEIVAKALGKPVGAIKALQHRALNTLRRMLLQEEKEGVYEPGK